VCDEFGLLLIGDEVISGFGRTGHWFARDHYAYEPDMLLFGKGMTSGYLPLSATVLNERVAANLEATNLPHGLTHAGHAVCCAAAVATMRIIESDDLIPRAHARGRYLCERVDELFARHGCIGDVRQLGLFSVIELVKDRATKEPFPSDVRLGQGRFGGGDVAAQVRAAMLEAGVRITAFRSTGIIALVPPLTITESEVDVAIERLDQVLRELDRA
jgi:taurine--2-oxoglutarate transaminase